MRRTFLHKWLALLLSLLLIISTVCSAPVSRTNESKPKFLIPDLARKIADESIPVRIFDINDVYHECHLLGWIKEGFIISRFDKIDTLKSEHLGFKIMVNTGKRQTGKGARIGCLTGVGCSALTILLTHQSVKTDPSDMAGLSYLAAGYAIIAIMGLTIVAGTAMGSARFEFDEYKFDKNYFAENPWLSMRYYQKAAIIDLHKDKNQID